MMKSIILACPTLRYELTAALTSQHATIPIQYIPQHLHETPDALQRHLQQCVHRLSNEYDRIIICVSSCGGGTAGLMSNSSELIIPRTRDCIDILLSNEDSLTTLQRPIDGVIFTKGWVDFNTNSPHSLSNLTNTKGKEYAENYIRNLYDGFNHFYFVDTGLGHLPYIIEKMTPLVDCLYGTSDIIHGNYGILKKIAREQFDEDFIKLSAHMTVDTSQFLSWC
ncbi:DUF1638 domain-containing protein [Veillonella montpellierensis]|uniref:DUF1638 domain-containing protein n=1 Tax=Veillonella montpellierensis TaxID=187328 RepID=UPI000907D3E6|nr:DUF1638 domain-containing protein [Veillonella montpellierensis]